MAIKVGPKSMRFTVTVPRDTARDIQKWAKEAGMSESTFITAALIVGARSLRKAEQLMGSVDEAGAVEMLARLAALKGDKFAVGGEE